MFKLKEKKQRTKGEIKKKEGRKETSGETNKKLGLVFSMTHTHTHTHQKKAVKAEGCDL